MKRAYVSLVAFTLFVAVASIAAVVFSQQAEPPQEAQTKKDHIVVPAVIGPAAESAALENSVRLSNAVDKERETVAARFRLQPTPSVRATYFQSILNDPDFRFVKWDLRILDVKSADGNTTVTLRATPIVKWRHAAAALVHGSLDETYDVGGEKLNLLKTDPPVDPAAPPKQFSISGM